MGDFLKNIFVEKDSIKNILNKNIVKFFFLFYFQLFNIPL